MHIVLRPVLKLPNIPLLRGNFARLLIHNHAQNTMFHGARPGDKISQHGVDSVPAREGRVGCCDYGERSGGGEERDGCGEIGRVDGGEVGCNCFR